MDSRETLRNLLLASVVFVAVMAIGPRLFPPRIPPPLSAPIGGPEGGEAGAPSAGSAASPGATSESIAAIPGVPAAETSPNGGLEVDEAEAELTETMGSALGDGIKRESASAGPYRMRLTLSNIGASIESATMTDHAETLGSDARYKLLSPVMVNDRTAYRSLAVERLNVDGVTLKLGDKKWHSEGVKETPEGQRTDFWLEIGKAKAPVLRLRRSYVLPQRNGEAKNFDLRADIVVENLSGGSQRVIVTYRGGTGVRREYMQTDDRYVDWGKYDGTRLIGMRKAQAEVAKNAGHPITLYKPSAGAPGERLSWAATANTYFTCTVAPLNRDGTDNASYLAEVAAVDADGSAFTNDDVAVEFITREDAVEPGGSLAYPAAVYLGEKDGHIFHGVPEYQRRNYYFQISQGFGWCTFTWLVGLMIWLLNSVVFVTRDYGVAIIVLVLVVRALLHPITKRGQVNTVKMQHRMQELAPKMEEIKKKYANDKARLNQEMMKLNVNPAGQMLLTCLPMLIQMPIWVALYLSLSSNIQMRHEAPFYGMTWVKDLTAPDALYTFPFVLVVPFFGTHIPAFNLLPILVSVFMYTQQKMQPKPQPNPNATEQQRQQQETMQKMTPIMTVMMLLIFYKMPSGLNLYIMSSSLFGTIEQHLIRKHIKEREAAGTLHNPEIKRDEDRPRRPAKPSFLQKLQQLAENAKKAQTKRPRKSKSRR